MCINKTIFSKNKKFASSQDKVYICLKKYQINENKYVKKSK